MKKVYLYWAGEKRKLPILEQLDEQKIDYEIGPSKSEHSFLMNNFIYYKRSFDLGLFSFCSDVWRFLKLSQNEGIYLDTSINIGKDFYKEIVSHRFNHDVFFKETNRTVGTAVLISENKSDIFNEALSIYKSFNLNPKFHIIGPEVLSVILMKRNFLLSGTYESESNSEIEVSTISFVRNQDTIYKYGYGSWFSDPSQAKGIWDRIENNYLNQKCRQDKNVSRAYIYGFQIININRFRIYFDEADKSEINGLAKLYKIQPFRKSVNELLIWSYLYRFFKRGK